MRKVRTEEAVGMVLAHDITRIVPGQFKGPAFRKGHIVTSEDISKLLDLGKENLYVWEAKDGWLHEDEAASAIVQAVGGKGLTYSEAKEGKINFKADKPGILKIDVARLEEINSIDQIVLACLHNNRPVEEGQTVAATRIIPLIIEEERINKVRVLGEKGPVIWVEPLQKMNVGIVTTGSEVFKGRIKDGFGPALSKKMEHYGCNIIKQVLVPDDIELIKKAIGEVKEAGAQIILVTGGMSVDPDDVTPLSIRELGATIVSYGAPVLPGAMFLIAYWKENIPVLGLPGCVMYAKHTIFDLIFPRILSGERITKKDLVKLGHGGLCMDCKFCQYPNCSFGKA